MLLKTNFKLHNSSSHPFNFRQNVGVRLREIVVARKSRPYTDNTHALLKSFGPVRQFLNENAHPVQSVLKTPKT